MSILNSIYKREFEPNPIANFLCLANRPQEASRRNISVVCKALDKINKNKLPNLDIMISKVLKEAKEKVEQQFIQIYYLLPERGIVLRDWKLVNLISITKNNCYKQTKLFLAEKKIHRCKCKYTKKTQQ